MLKVKVQHRIGDIVEHALNKRKFMVVGYLYIHNGSIKYVCLEDDKADRSYLLDCELKPSIERTIGFVLDHNIQKGKK